MNISGVVSASKKHVIDNSPGILTGIGVVGVVTTSLLSAKTGIRVNKIIRDMEQFREIPPTREEKVKAVWVEFIPPVVSGALTIVCIVGANRIGNRRAAAIAAAMATSEKLFDEYRSKVVEKLGEREEAKARAEIAQDRVSKAGESLLIIEEGTDVLCFEEYTGRYFRSNIEAIRKAENAVNHQIIHENYASLSDFYGHIGLETTKYSDEVGWKGDRLMSVNFSSVISPEGRPCVAIDYSVEPVREYYKAY